MRSYSINVEKLCETQRFNASQVVLSELVFPKGAVPNAQIIWFKMELSSGERVFLTKPLQDFYEYVELPESSIGGWTDGDIGTDSSGHESRYAIDDSGGSEPVSGEVQHGTKSVEEVVAP